MSNSRSPSAEKSIQPSGVADPDARLMLQVRGGDAAAFEELVGRYQDRLVTVMEHHVGRRDLAEDLVQEVFLRVYRARERYTADAKFATWVYTIANNVALNAHRSRSRRQEVNLDPGASGPLGPRPLDTLATAASGEMPTRQADREEMRAIVRQSLGVLNERQRMAVLLNKFENMSYAEIAAAMDITPKAVKSLLSRARTALRDYLEPYIAEGSLPGANQP